jgi:hypothetical protein
MTADASIVTADAWLVRLPMDPPKGDAIQRFDGLELPIMPVRAGARWRVGHNRAQ